jgi:hypothetical protein
MKEGGCGSSKEYSVTYWSCMVSMRGWGLKYFIST